MTSLSIPLGDFVLLDPIGRGGMGQVYRGMHRRDHVPVAVKVLSHERIGSPEAQASFRNEVRSVARLHHRNIIMVFDQGRITPEAAKLSDGLLVAGSPYLAMELVTGGTLARVAAPMKWATMRSALLEILDALAHAHARGVIHRDLKPANVLLSRPADSRPGLKLSDFGIAHAIDHQGENQFRTNAGTLRYMAPEQLSGRWRDEGPWTDLYALGIMAYFLASATHPFGSADGEHLVNCHLNTNAPVVVPVHEMPAGFAQWIERLLAKRPANRFERAIDAAWALKQLTPNSADLSGELILFGSDDELGPDTEVDATLPSNPDGWVDSDGDTADSPVAGARKKRDNTVSSTTRMTDAKDWTPPGKLQKRAEVPPLPQSWRRPDHVLAMRLLGAGMGLYGLRPIPMVARDQERDTMWSALAEVTETGNPRLLALTGKSGCGKSRLVEWISQRAHEVGGAVLLKATHSPIVGPSDGLVPMIASHLQCSGLDRGQVRARCKNFVAENPCDAGSLVDALEMAELIAPSTDESQNEPKGANTRVRLVTPADRHRTIRRLLERICQRRTALIWLDDVQWGSDALAFCHYLLSDRRLKPLPIVLVLTVRDDALAERPVATAQFEALLRLTNSATLPIAPLTAKDHAALVERLLGLSGELADRVSERTSGNPLFAVQLIGDWVERGVLQPTAKGFAISDHEHATMPNNIHELWSQRVMRVCQQLDNTDLDQTLSALEIAAALGQEVVTGEWQRACDISSLRIPPGFVEALLSQRLAYPRSNGWSFAHSLLRESLQRQSMEQGRWPEHHRACATMLEQLHDRSDIDIAERYARHVLDSDDLGTALTALMDAAERRRLATDFHRAQSLYGSYEVVLSRLGAGPGDRRLGRVWVRRARAYAFEGRLDRAEELATLANQRATEHGWTDVAAWAFSVLGYCGLARGDTSAGHTAYSESLTRFRTIDDACGMADCLTGFGDVCMWRRDLANATEHYREAYALRKHSADLYESGIILRGMANVRFWDGDLDESRSLIEQAKDCFERNGSRYYVAYCLNDLGEMERTGGKLEEAERLYQESARLFETLGCTDASTPHFNLGLVLLNREKYARAREIFTTELDILRRAERTIDMLWLHAGLLPCAAAKRDWPAWDHHMRRMRVLLKDLGDEDIPWCAQRAADLAYRACEWDRARDAYEFARVQWEQTGRLDKVAQVDRALSLIPTF